MTDQLLVEKKLALDLDILRDILEHRLDDLLVFMQAVRSRLAFPPPPPKT